MTLLPPYSLKVWKAIGLCIAGVVLLGVVLFTFDRCGDYWTGRSIDKHKANVNAALKAANAQRGTVANDRINEAVAVEKVKEATKQAIEASEASEAAKQAANIALERYEQARKANMPTGTSEQELIRALDGLE